MKAGNDVQDRLIADWDAQSRYMDGAAWIIPIFRDYELVLILVYDGVMKRFDSRP